MRYVTRRSSGTPAIASSRTVRNLHCWCRSSAGLRPPAPAGAAVRHGATAPGGRQRGAAVAPCPPWWQRPDRPGRPRAGSGWRDVGLQLPHAPHPLLDLGNDLRLAIQLVDLQNASGAARSAAETDWPGQRRCSGLPARSPLSPACARRPLKLQHQARFAHAGLAGMPDDLPAPSLDLTEALP